MRVLRNNSSLTLAEHQEIGRRLAAMRGAAGAILDILNGRVRVRYLDRLARFINGMQGGGFCTLRSDLEDDLFEQHPDASLDIYYGPAADRIGRGPSKSDG
jgi:hypothetical protein